MTTSKPDAYRRLHHLLVPMNSAILRPLRSLLAATALWVTAYAIAASGSAAPAPGTSIDRTSVAALMQASVPAATPGSLDAASVRVAAAPRSLGVERSAMPEGTPVADGRGAAGLVAWLGHAPISSGAAFVLAGIGLMATIARRRRID